MPRLRLKSRRSRSMSVGAAVVVAALGATMFIAPGVVSAGKPKEVDPPPAAPLIAGQIQNIDQVKTAIKGYYGDTVTAQVDPVNGTTPLHTFNPSGNYAAEMGNLVADAEDYLADTKTTRHLKGTKAILFDVDDTLLNTYNYEIYSNFVYNPATNAAFVNSASFPAVPHMVALEQAAVAEGYTVFFLTGRPEAQRTGTITNLTTVGFTVSSPKLYLKDLVNQPWESSCSPTCTTIQYKSLTRQHIESLGYDIVANFGDQFSDLTGGFADETFKVPNPMYYLP